MAKGEITAQEGSFPLTRGKLDSENNLWEELRLISAHAGKTSPLSVRCSPDPAHPRSRGENSAACMASADAGGSSPLTQGKRLHHGTPIRLIQAHPRSRRENPSTVRDTYGLAGSSPLTRGKLRRAVLHGVPRGLIPAHAGKTRRRASPTGGRPAHPRSHGENNTNARRGSSLPGSSPLTRGKQVANSQLARLHRLIPAHAGKTGPLTGCRCKRTAHPRSRGENMADKAAHPRCQGSSPLTRGKLLGAGQYIVRDRLIPAHAGKTDKCLTGIQSGSAHPRSRGENEWVQNSHRPFTGSSPLTRGKPKFGMTYNPLFGLIPAHAGKTRTSRTLRQMTWAHPRSRGENACQT